MENKIFLNEEEFNFKKENIPCLVTYAHGAGGSNFSVAMIADLFLHGSKVLFLTAYPMAKENFFERINGKESEVNYVDREEGLDINSPVIMVESGNEELFLKILGKIKDQEERIVFIKNFEVFSESLVDSCIGLPKIIFSGDIDKCSADTQEKLLNINYRTIIAFSKPQAHLKFDVPILEKYTGYLWSEKEKGFVKLLV